MSNFANYLRTIGKSEKTAKNYSSTIFGPISQWAIDNNLSEGSLADIEGVVEFEQLSRNIRKLSIYNERNSVGKGMYNAALNAYSAYLADTKGVYLERDIDEILEDPETTQTEKQALVKSRIGQGDFRRKLVDYWKGCAATGYRNTRLLVASHIKPWRNSNDSERLNVFNGLLLSPNLDKAFDLGYIGFGANGKIHISAELEEPELLGVTDDLSVNLEPQHIPFIEYHLENSFKQ